MNGYTKGNAETALEFLVSELREQGVLIRMFSQGEGAVPGMTYYRAQWFNGVRVEVNVASCDWQNGLELDERQNGRISAVIRAHCSLYYAIVHQSAAALTDEQLDRARMDTPPRSPWPSPKGPIHPSCY